jgi:hypothetical protein
MNHQSNLSQCRLESLMCTARNCAIQFINACCFKHNWLTCYCRTYPSAIIPQSDAITKTKVQN